MRPKTYAERSLPEPKGEDRFPTGLSNVIVRHPAVSLTAQRIFSAEPRGAPDLHGRANCFAMFYENTHNDFSFEAGLPSSSPESEARHLINRLRLEFRTASQRQLEDAVAAAVASTPGVPSEKIFQSARASLEQLLTPLADRLADEPVNSEPPFRTEVKMDDVNAARAS